ncbi:MAG TPA: hypothetical protein VF246_05810 [Acidimicrobiia bacterium]|jgi:hypothetical protein
METSDRHSRVGFWLVTVLVVTTLANLVAGQLIPRSLQAVLPRDGGSLYELVLSGQRGLAHQYGFYLGIGELRGRRIYAPAGVLDPILLDALGGMELREADYPAADHDLPQLGEPESELRTVDGRTVPYWLIAGDPGDDYWLAAHEGGYVAVPVSLMPLPEGDG